MKLRSQGAPRSLSAMKLCSRYGEQLAFLLVLAMHVTALDDSCVTWQGLTSPPLETCLPSRPPLQSCGQLSRMFATIPGITETVNIDPRRITSPDPPGAACCVRSQEDGIIQALQSQMLELWKAPGLQGRCLDMVQVMYCAISCSPQQSTFIRRKGSAPQLQAGPDTTDGETCVDPTCANTDGNGAQFSQNNCGSAFHLRSNLSVVCASAGCSPTECCEADNPTCYDTAGDGTHVEYNLCATGEHVVAATCQSSVCTSAQCCAPNPTCMNVSGNGSIIPYSSCGANMALKSNLTITCQGANCTDADCCETVASCSELSPSGYFVNCGNFCTPRTNCSQGARRRTLEAVQVTDMRARERTQLEKSTIISVRILQDNPALLNGTSISNFSQSNHSLTNGINMTNMTNIDNFTNTCADDLQWQGPGNLTCSNISLGHWVNSSTLNATWVNGSCDIFTVVEHCPLSCGQCSEHVQNVQCQPGQYRASNGTMYYCAEVTNCTSSQFEAVAATLSNDRQCTDLTTCNGAQFEIVQPTATTDRQCQTLTVCDAQEQYTRVGPTSSTDRQCDYKVEAVVCLSLCEIMFQQCGANLKDNFQVPNAASFCQLLFHRHQIRVENASIDLPEYDQNQNRIPHCLYIDTPPLTNIAFASRRMFLDEDQISVPVAIVDAETIQLPLNYITAAASNTSLVSLQIRWSYSQETFMIDMSPKLDTGDTDVTVCARDASGGSHCDTFLLEVRPDQTPPELILAPGGALMEDEVGLVMVTVSEVDVFPEAVIVSVTSANELLMPSSNILVLGPNEAPCNTTFAAGSAQLASCRFIQMHATPNLNGEAQLMIEAYDGVFTANATFQLVVQPANDPPQILSSFSDIVVEEDASISAVPVEVVDDGDPVVNSLTGQLDAGDLTLSLVVEVDDSSVITDANYLPRMQFVVSGGGPFNFTMLLPQHAFGEAIVSVDVTDGQFVDRKQFHLTVLAVNDAPTIADITEAVTNEDVPLRIPLPIIDVDNAMDQLYVTGYSSNPVLLPSEELRFSLINDTWFLDIIPSQNLFGKSAVTVGVTDGLLNDEVTFNVTVRSVNDPPVAANVRSELNNSDLLVWQFEIADVETQSHLFSIAPLRMGLSPAGISQRPQYVLPCTSPCIYASTSHHVLIPLENVRFGGSAASRFVTIEPNQVMSGDVIITIFLDDGDNVSSFDLSYSLVAMTVDVSITLSGTIEQFDANTRKQAQYDLAAAAQVKVSHILILDVRAGSVILVAAVMVPTAEDGIKIATELTRLVSFGKLTVAGFDVQSMELNVLGDSFALRDWESMNDMWGALVCAMFCIVFAMTTAARAVLVSQTTTEELIDALKTEFLDDQNEEDFNPLQRSVAKANNTDDLPEEMPYVDFDIRHICIWLSTFYEAAQIAWIIVEATARELGWWKNGTAVGITLDTAALIALDFRDNRFLVWFKGLATLYTLLPGMWLISNVLFVATVGYIVMIGTAWNKHSIAGRVDRMVASYWRLHQAIRGRLLHHRDETCQVFFDGLMLIPVTRSCFKIFTCRFDLQAQAENSDRAKFRALGSSLYMIEDENVTCWRGLHLILAVIAFSVLLAFLLVTIRYTVEFKGRAGAAMRFSSRAETARVTLVVCLVALSQVFSDRCRIILWICLSVVTLLLASNIFLQPALGLQGATLNATRSGLMSALAYLTMCCLLLVSYGRAASITTVVFAVCAVPCICLFVYASHLRDRTRRLRFTRHIQKALSGGVTDAASLHAAGDEAAVNPKQLSEFINSSVDLLLLVLQSEDAARRAHAATALGEIALSPNGNSHVLNLGGTNRLTILLHDNSSAVRVASLSALGMIATTDDGLDEIGDRTVVACLNSMLQLERNEHVFAAAAWLLCTLMYCHDPEVRQASLDALVLMTSHSMHEARETAWSALQKLGVQNEREGAQDEVTARFVGVLLDRKAGNAARVHAAQKLSDVMIMVTSHSGHTTQLSIRETQLIL
eukprot:COSAG05_NODE_905_length_6647_cov_42.260385_1_plen_1974_part_10